MTQSFYVLHELRLPTGDDATRLLAATQLAGMPREADEQVLPLLVSIDDHRDVACLSRSPLPPAAGDQAGARILAALAPEAESSGPPRYYRERASSGEREGQGYFRMAVTESGLNDRGGGVSDPAAAAPDAHFPPGTHDSSGEGLLWIGTPVASGAGLLILTGHHDASAYAEGDPAVWPLGTSRALGVRIYESERP